ncbi:hypothetical protein MD484_g7168, partial [Candolleomyces efflorescens]
MAALLSDQIDSLNRRTRSIKAVASQIAPTAPSTRSLNPFTQAVLYAEIGDLIRDVEATELGLFTLIKSAGTSDPNERQLRRVDFVGATPLKKVPARREERAVEVPPEVYTEAALKFLRTYNKFKPMPRATKQLSDIINRLQSTRSSLAQLEAELKEKEKDQQEAGQPAPPVAPKASLKAEEEEIRRLHSKLEELTERKKELQSQKSRQQKPAAAQAQKHRPPASPEDKFWGTPGDASRTLKFSTNLLVDEEVDFNGLNDASFSMPTPEKGLAAGIATSSLNFAHSDPSPPPPEPVIAPLLEEPGPTSPEPLLPVSTSPPTPAKQPPSALEESVSQTPKSGIRVSTEVEKITTKIASVYGDLLALAQARKPTSGKEVIACLRTLSVQTPSAESPSHSSTSTATSQTPGAQEVLTAFLLLELLSAPGRTMTLNKLKDIITAKKSSIPVALGVTPNRIIYACVGKRMIRIDRSGGEQLAKFDC